jgi:hypothetical protein
MTNDNFGSSSKSLSGNRYPTQAKQARKTEARRREKGTVEATTSFTKDSETLGSTIDLGVMAPSQQVYSPDLVSVMEFIDAIVERYAMVTELFVFPSYVAPSYLGFYLQMCFLVYIKKHGQLTGSSAGNIPINFDEWAIPLPFAQFLEGFGTYNEDGSSHRFSMEHNNIIGVQNSYWGAFDSSTTLASRNFYPPGWQIAVMSPNSLDNIPSTGIIFAPPVTEITFTASVMATISEQISGAGLSYVKGTAISGCAPDGSAYAFVSQDVNLTLTTPGLCTFLLSEIDNFNAETSLIYNKHNPLLASLGTSSARMHSKKCVCMGTDDQDTTNPWFIQPQKLFIFVKSTVKEFKHVPLHILKYCKVSLTTLFPSSQTYSWQGFATMVNNHYSACYRSAPTNMPAPPENVNFHHLAAYQIVCYMSMWARFMRAIPYWKTYFFVTGQSFYTPQSFYASIAWQSFRLPAVIVENIEAVGPVVYKGRLYYPTFPMRVFATQALSLIDPGPVWSAGQAWTADTNPQAPFGMGLYWYNNIGGTLFPPTPAAQTLVVGYNRTGVLLSTQITLNNYTLIPPFPGTFTLFTLNAHASTLYKYFDSFHSNQSFSTSMNKSLVHQHYNKCGAAYLLLCNLTGSYQPVNTAGAEMEDLITQDDIIGGAASMPVRPVMNLAVYSHAASLIQMSPGDLLLAWTFALNVRDQNNVSPLPLVDGKFVAQLPSSVSTAALIEQLMEATYMNGTGFVDAVSIRQAKFKDDMFKGVVDGIHPADAVDQCFVKDLLKGAVNLIAKPLKLGVSVAAGGLCTAGAVALGLESISGLAGDICSAGAIKAVDYISSRVGIDANDVNLSNNNPGYGKKAKVRAVRSVASMAKQSVRVDAKKKKSM